MLSRRFSVRREMIYFYDTSSRREPRVPKVSGKRYWFIDFGRRLILYLRDAIRAKMIDFVARIMIDFRYHTWTRLVMIFLLFFFWIELTVWILMKILIGLCTRDLIIWFSEAWMGTILGRISIMCSRLFRRRCLEWIGNVKFLSIDAIKTWIDVFSTSWSD